MSKLKEYCLRITDGEHGTVIDDPLGECYLLSNKNIIDGEIIITDADRKINRSTLEKINKRTQISIGCVLIATVGTVGKTAVIRNTPNYAMQRSVGIIQPNPELLDADYLKYYLDSPIMQKRIDNSVKGAIQKCLFISDIEDLDVDIPTLSEQKRMVQVLGAIDGLINNNKSICSDLEAMAKQLYDYWFVQFDFPDENGKPYKSSGGKMVWNEELKREIPEGWEVSNLYSIADFINGLACQKFRPIDEQHKLPVIKISEMHNGVTDNTEFVRDDIDSSHIINNGDILFAWSASLEIMLWNGGKAGLNQHIFKVVPKVASSNYVYLQLQSYIVNFVRMAESRKTTMGHITTDHLNQSRIAVPKSTLLEKFQYNTSALFEEITKLKEETQELTSLRDFLLPMLMNGQVKVGKAGA